MAASWASATIISKNRGELKYMKIGLKGNTVGGRISKTSVMFQFVEIIHGAVFYSL
jgi:hypothetical protein